MPTMRQKIVSVITRLYPLYSGCGTLANHRITQWLAGRSAELAWGRVYGGFIVPAPLDDFVGRAIYYSGEFDRKITWVCSRIVRSGDTVLDIGANLGLVTFTLSSLVGENGHVFAFEPIPQLQELIDQAIIKNRVSNVTVCRTALGSSSGDMSLSIPIGHAGRLRCPRFHLASLVPSKQNSVDLKLKVPVQTLSSFCKERNLGKLRLVKIDVEGFEPEVLKGAAGFFSRNPPDTILFELNDHVGPIAEHPSISILDRLGYNFFGIPKCLFKMRLRPLDLSSNWRSDLGHDVLAVHRGTNHVEIAHLVNASP